MQDWDELTTQANLEPYERRLSLSPSGGNEVRSEWERHQQNYPCLRDCFELFDMSGSEQFPHAGEGFVPEIVANIEAVLRQRHHPQLRSVFIDWAGILVQRHMSAIGARDDALRHYLTRFIGECRRNIAEAFSCTVWVMHQIKGSMITASPTKLFHHGEAAEASAFGAEMSVCACIGAPDRETGCRRLNFSKVRSSPWSDHSPRLAFLAQRATARPSAGRPCRTRGEAALAPAQAWSPGLTRLLDSTPVRACEPVPSCRGGKDRCPLPVRA